MTEYGEKLVEAGAQWKYTTRVTGSPRDLRDALVEMGTAGWELAGVVPPLSGYLSSPTLVFKRRTLRTEIAEER